MNTLYFSEDVASIFEATPNAILVFNKKSELVFSNNLALVLFGYSREESTSLKIENFVPQRIDNHAKLRDNFHANPSRRLMGEGKSLFAVKKNGTEFPVEIGLNPLSINKKDYVVAHVNDITERVQNRKEIKENEERFQSIIQATPNAVILVNQKGDIELANKMATELFGYTEEQFKTLSIDQLIPKRVKAHDKLRADYHKNPTTRKMGASRNLTGLRKDGTEVPVEVGLNPLEIKGEKYVIANVTDITERIKHQIESKENEERFRSIIHASPNAVILVNQKGDIELANKMATELFGYTEEQFKTLSIDQLIPKRVKAHDKLRADYHKNPTTRKMGASRNLTGLRKDGTEVPVEVGLNPLEIKGEKYVIANVTDITERIKHQIEIKENEERFRSIINASPNAVILVDKTGAIELVNPMALKLFGYTESEMTSLNIDSLVPKRVNDHSKLRGKFHQNPTTRTMGANKDLSALRKDGSEIPVEIGLNPLEINGRSFVLANVIDITERKNYQHKLETEVAERTVELKSALDNLKQSQDKIVEQEKMASLGSLIAGIAHEINTPLGAIKSSVSRLIDEREDFEQTVLNFSKIISDEDFKTLNKWVSSGNKGVILSSREERKLRRAYSNFLNSLDLKNLALVESLMALRGPEDMSELEDFLKSSSAEKAISSYGKLASLESDIDRINMAVDKVSKIVYSLKFLSHSEANNTEEIIDIRETLENVLNIYANQIKHGINLSTTFSEGIKVRGNTDQIIQVWTNLLSNAIQAMNGVGKLDLSMSVKENLVWVRFKDYGTGIPEDIVEKIFNPFFTTKPKGQGTGLGLDIVKKIINEHGGEISVESELDLGATFNVCLPIVTA